MHPILLKFPHFTLYTQTVCLIAAFIAGLLVAAREGRRRFAIPRVDLTDVVLWGFLSAILGARLLFLLLFWETSTFTLQEFCTLGTQDGGFALHGGLLAGGTAAWLTARWHRLNVWRVGDALAPGLAVAMFFMRLGCLLNGCDYGVATTMPWGIWLHGAVRHPIQLYEGGANLALLPFLLHLNRTSSRPGQTLWVYLLGSALIRVGVDVFREDFQRVGGVFTIPQLIA
jgi:phosphatidylglycerol:prolipoprotein diacylglycerol transferase